MITLAGLAFTGIIWIKNQCCREKEARIDKYYTAIQVLTCKIHPDLEQDDIEILERELNQINRDAAQDMVSDKIKADESYLIYQNMQNSCRSMLDRAYNGVWSV